MTQEEKVGKTLIVFPFASWPPLSPSVTGLVLCCVPSLTAKCREPRTLKHMLRSSVLPWCLMATFCPAIRSPHGRTRLLRHPPYCTFAGAGGGSLFSSKSSHCQEVPLPSCLEGQRPIGMGWNPAFSSNCFFQDKGQLVQGNREP